MESRENQRGNTKHNQRKFRRAEYESTTHHTITQAHCRASLRTHFQ